MGRELRRVALDFDWPLQKVWKGFVNPHWKPCPEAAKNKCHNGYTSAGKWLEALSRLILLVGTEASLPPEYREGAAARGRIYPHPYLQEWSTAPRNDVSAYEMEQIKARYPDDPIRRHQAYLDLYRMAPPSLMELDSEIADLVKRLADGRSLDHMTGGMESYAIARNLVKAAGLDPDKWGECKVCNGHAQDPASEEAYDNWTGTPPPEGPGYQLWETVSEGSPVSPVFPTEKAFIEYLVGQGYSAEASAAFCRTGWAPSMVVDSRPEGTTFYSDIEASGALEQS